MAHLWQFHDASSCWQPQPVGQRFSLPHGVRLVKAGAGPAPMMPAPEIWLLLAAPGASVRVNGEPLLLGARVLRDKDEIHVTGFRYFFSTEKLAHVTTFRASGAGSVFCARCKQPMIDGEAAVACPACGAWHHESEKMPCWLYGKTCALCSQPTALDAGYQWTPETEEVWL